MEEYQTQNNLLPWHFSCWRRRIVNNCQSRDENCTFALLCTVDREKFNKLSFLRQNLILSLSLCKTDFTSDFCRALTTQHIEKKKKSVAGSAGKTSPNCLLDATKCISRYFLSIEPDSGDFEDTEENESAEAMDEGETEEA